MATKKVRVRDWKRKMLLVDHDLEREVVECISEESLSFNRHVNNLLKADLRRRKKVVELTEEDRVALLEEAEQLRMRATYKTRKEKEATLPLFSGEAV